MSVTTSVKLAIIVFNMKKILTAMLLCITTIGPALAQVSNPKFPAASPHEIQLVIKNQLAAFAADDAQRAFAIAAPNIQQMFGSAERFMQMVRHSYPVVYRPTSVTFLISEQDGDAVSQPVAMTDTEGRSWTAVYRLEQGKDKLWRIAGCVLFMTNPRKQI
jgi:hypothetical protein